MIVTIKGINKEIWLAARARALVQNLNIGDWVNSALTAYLEGIDETDQQETEAEKPETLDNTTS